MKPALRCLLVTLLCVPVLALGWHGSRLLSAEVLAADAGKLLKNQAPVYAYEKASKAAALLPYTNEYKVVQLRSAYRQRHYRLALQHARELVMLSPADAKSWLRVAQIKISLAEYDRELALALERAYKYAPHFDSIQLQFARLGIIVWPYAAGDMRNLFGQSFNYILAHPFRYRFMDYLFKNQKESIICPAYANNDEVRDWCGKKKKLRQICSTRRHNQNLTRWCKERGIEAFRE